MGVIIEIKEKVVDVTRHCDRQMTLRLVLPGTYFQRDFGIRNITNIGRLVMGADMNGKVGEDAEDYEVVHGCQG